ncbi:MAG: hypothetical protein ABIP03_01545 [Aquihabitans sp.]
MRKLAVILVSLLAVAAGAAPADAARSSSIRIDPRASKIYLYDGSPDGTGPSFPATRVSTVVNRCEAGDYYLDATLTQDGVNLPWATGALGAGEFACDGTSFRTQLSMSFYGPTLHPGRATAHFALRKYECVSGVCYLSDTPTVEATSAVHIPGRRHYPTRT